MKKLKTQCSVPALTINISTRKFMIHLLTRTTSFMLVFGFFFTFIACSTLELSVDDAENSLESADYERALSTVSNLLIDDPESEELHLIKARALKNIALGQEHASVRFDYYREMKYSTDLLENSQSASMISNAANIVDFTWQEEFGAAEHLWDVSESDSYSQSNQQIIDHLENAILINPDIQTAYSLKSKVHYRNGDLQLAVSTLQTANDKFGELPLDLKEQHAYLLLEEGQLQAAIEIYQELLDEYPQNDEIKHGLVNAYILDENHESSIDLLRELTESNQGNLSYHEALATELFFHIQSSLGKMAETDVSDEIVLERYESLMDELDEAESLYRHVQENHPDPAEITFITAAFYKNTAGTLLNLADTRNEELAVRLKEKAENLLVRSVPVWQEVADRNPENPEIWRSIYQIYSQLNMTDEAEDARNKANL
jgi:tetratricopeptide (TPR) repeat protein